ncbi:MAG: DUF2442 domain-containing protein [Vulcanimicrobiaceae bacterium]
MAKTLAGSRTERVRAAYEEKMLSLLSVSYDARADAVRLSLSSGARLSIPRRQIPPLAKAAPEQLAGVYAGNGGATISQDDLDVDVSVPGLLDRLFGRTIRGNLGRRAGRVSTLAKARAARKNGRKGGRPKKRTA